MLGRVLQRLVAVAVALVAGAAFLLVACGSDSPPEDAEGGQEDATSTANSEATTSSSTTAAADTEQTAAGDTGGSTDDGSPGQDGDPPNTDETENAVPVEEEEPVRVDWLTFGRGMTFVSLTGLQSGSANNALLAVNGDPATYGVTKDDNTVAFVFELPAMTTLDRLAVPNVLDRPGNDTAVKFLTVEGSAESAEAGWQVLADTEFELHEEEGQVTELELLAEIPIRWLRLTMSGGILVEPGDEGKTIVRFSELIGNGTQEPFAATADFNGLWEFDNTERPDFDGKSLELAQTGSTITGCWGDVVLTGSVNGAIARATGMDLVRNRPAAFIFVSDRDDGSISALVSENNGFFKPYITAVNDDIDGCLDEETAEPVICESSVYINFDVDSAAIRPESFGVLGDLYDLLVSDGTTVVTIVGHTSTEGDEDYNLDLSQRRAQAVVDDLVSRGFAAAGISAEGRGEAEPKVSPDDTETAREINRRVDIVCG